MTIFDVVNTRTGHQKTLSWLLSLCCLRCH